MDAVDRRGAGGEWRASLYSAQPQDSRHQPEDADPDAAPDGTRRAGPPHRPPGGAAQGRISPDRPRPRPQRILLRRMALGRKQPGSGRGRAAAIRLKTFWLTAFL